MILYTLVILSVTVVVVSENRNPVKSLAWVTVLLVVPGIGLILYIVFGRNIQSKRIISRRNRRKLRRQSRLALGGMGDTEVPEELGTLPSQVSKLAQALCGTPYHDNNRVEIFDNGTEKFEALLRDISQAQSYINLQYYIIAGDATARRLADALIERAAAGVKVRVIYDHVGSFAAPRSYFKRLERAGIEAYPFFKVTFPPFGTRINWRNHRKLCVIDGRVGYIGGMNIADRYLTGGCFGVWRDLHLRLEGPAVVSLQQSFAVDWNFMGRPLLTDHLEVAEPVVNEPAHPTVGMQLVTGGPTSQWMNLTLVFLKAISMAKRRVWIQTPYFIPTEGLLQALQTAALARVDVRLMMPRRSDSDMLRWASGSYITECMRAGIKVYLYQKGMLHSKAIIIDDTFATVGSTNFDFRSFEHNFECNMLVYGPSFNRRMLQVFLRDQRDCLRLTPHIWRQRHLRLKALESTMRLLAPIL